MAEASGGERGFHADHRALDDVGAGPLDRRVDRGAFGPWRSPWLREAMRGKCVLRPNSVLVKPFSRTLDSVSAI
jgi:hypothetical protein